MNDDDHLEASARLLMRAHNEKASSVAIGRCVEAGADHNEDMVAAMTEIVLIIRRLEARGEGRGALFERWPQTIGDDARKSPPRPADDPKSGRGHP